MSGIAMRLKTKGGVWWDVVPYRKRYWRVARVEGDNLVDHEYYMSLEGMAVAMLERASTRKDKDCLLELVHLVRAVREDIRELKWVDK